jgi:hypothetical protein
MNKEIDKYEGLEPGVYVRLEQSLIDVFKEKDLPEQEAKDIFRLYIKYMRRKLSKYFLPGVLNSEESALKNLLRIKQDLGDNYSSEDFINKISKLYE